MSESEFERRMAHAAPGMKLAPLTEGVSEGIVPVPLTLPMGAVETEPASSSRAAGGTTRTRATRSKAVKARRVQRMFAIEEELDKKLWLFAIHVGKDRSEVINDLLRPVVASMVLYDSRDRRGARASEPEPEERESGEAS
jgi:hypothetical protein